MNQEGKKHGIEHEQRRNEEQRLQLALLKENCSYRNFWDQYGGEKLREIYRRIFEDPKWHNDPEFQKLFQLSICKTPELREDRVHLGKFFSGLREQFKIHAGILIPECLTQEWLNRLDPYKQNDAEMVTFHDPLPTISQVYIEGQPQEHRYTPIDTPLKMLFNFMLHILFGIF
jgi:hypothetical protein